MQINSTFDSATGVASLPASDSPYYALVWFTQTANGITTQRCVNASYISSSKQGTRTKNNILGFSTWAELVAYATTNNIVGLPSKDPTPAS